MAKESFLERIRKKSVGSDEEANLRKELLELKIQNTSGQLKETHKIRQTRKLIAQLKTLEKEKSEEL
tara:strand:- start:21607 stop:21807 length:201 start_codon:yes stop_codon:yes gene_type:complete